MLYSILVHVLIACKLVKCIKNLVIVQKKCMRIYCMTRFENVAFHAEKIHFSQFQKGPLQFTQKKLVYILLCNSGEIEDEYHVT